MEEKTKMKAKLDREDIEKMKYNDIKKLAKDMNLDVSGSKQDIIDRICNIDVEVDEITQEELEALGKDENITEDSENNAQETLAGETEEKQTTTPENENNAQIEENEQKTDTEKKSVERLEVDGVIKVVFSGQVRLRRTPYIANDNVIKLEPNGAIFRVVAIVSNEQKQGFYELSNGAYILKDDKLVEFKLG